MVGELLTLQDVAERLGVSRRRAQAFVEQRRLPARRVGNQWLVSASHVRRLAHTMQSGPGRPLSQQAAWRRISEQRGQRVTEDLDGFRRRVHPRARTLDGYVHPGLLGRLHERREVVLGGLEAAAAAGCPVDSEEPLDVYVRASDRDSVAEDVGFQEAAEGANVYLHVVDDRAWPFDDDRRVTGAWTAWLDLEDRLDRAAHLVLDRVTGGRVAA